MDKMTMMMVIMLLIKSWTCDIALDSAESQLYMCILLSNKVKYVLLIFDMGPLIFCHNNLSPPRVRQLDKF